MAISATGLALIAQSISVAALSPDKWTDVLHQMRQQIGEVRAHMFGFDTERLETALMTYAGYDPEVVDHYEQHYSAINSWAPGFSRFEAGRVIPSQAMCAEDDLLRTTFYNEWVAPQEDVRLGGGALLIKEPTRTFMIGANIRQKDGIELQQTWLSTLAMVTPLLQQAIEINRALAGHALEAHLYQSGLVPGTAAMAVLRSSGHPIHCNRSAERLLDQGDLLRLDAAGRLRMSSPDVEDCVDRVRRGGIGASSGALVARDGNGSLWDLNVFALDDQSLSLVDGWKTPLNGAGPLTVVVLRPRPETDPIQHAGQVLGLTAAEIDVVRALSLGHTLSEIADARGRSLVTIRNQLKSAMQKTGTRRQVELVLLLKTSAGLEQS